MASLTQRLFWTPMPEQYYEDNTGGGRGIHNFRQTLLMLRSKPFFLEEGITQYFSAL